MQYKEEKDEKNFYTFHLNTFFPHHYMPHLIDCRQCSYETYCCRAIDGFDKTEC